MENLLAAIQKIEVVLKKYKGSDKADLLNATKDISALLQSKAGGTRTGSITDAIYKHFDTVGVENATLADALEIARTIKPNTAFDRTHLAYHKSKYRVRTTVPASKN